MMDLIDRDKIPNYKIWGVATAGNIKQPVETRILFWKDIMAMPTINPYSLVPHGRWIEKNNVDHHWFECSECGNEPLRNQYGQEGCSAFCPNCGAKMDG